MRLGLLSICFSVALIALIFTMGAADSSRPLANQPQDCLHILRSIDAAKWQWFLEHNKATNDTPTWEDLHPYLVAWGDLDTSQKMPVCPEGGTYTIGRVADCPTCSIGGPNHTLCNPTNRGPVLISFSEAGDHVGDYVTISGRLTRITDNPRLPCYYLHLSNELDRSEFLAFWMRKVAAPANVLTNLLRPDRRIKLEGVIYDNLGKMEMSVGTLVQDR